MLNAVFIAGTDTDVGKTYIAAGLLQAFKDNQLSVLGIKPLASGCVATPEGLRNADALLLQKISTRSLNYACINPIALLPPIAPHIAAQKAQEILSITRLATACQPALSAPVDICVIEGAGGWFVPLNLNETMADFVVTMNWPVILVVGMRLGCLNHALLTVKAMQAQEVPLLGWVANFVSPDMPAGSENLTTLTALLDTPLLGVVPYGESASSRLNMVKILSIFNETR